MTTIYATSNKQAHKRKTILFVVYPGVKLLDLAGPLQAFVDALDDNSKPAYTTAIASLDGSLTNSDTPVSVSTTSLPSWKRRHIDTLIIVGGDGVYKAIKNSLLLDSIRSLASKSNRVASICSGAFILAACGILDGRRAVTHWESCEKLATSYPALDVETDPIFINDDNVWTSAGVTAGIDMAIAMIAEDLGRQAALLLARSLVTYFVRPGGQSQFSEVLNLQITDGEGLFDSLHQWIQKNLHKNLTVERLAEQTNMSSRNFSRMYLAQTGKTPAKAVEAIRLETARRMLEDNNANIHTITDRCGFGSYERMRRVFQRRLSISPQKYRDRFQSKESN